MFFRFASALILVVVVSMAGIALEKQTLQMKRAVSRQYFQVDLLLEMHAKLRLGIQELTAPSQLAEINAADSGYVNTPQTGVDPSTVSKGKADANLPLLRWQRPARNGGFP